MGLRRWLNRQAKRSGVQDPIRGASAYPVYQRREWVLNTIDSSSFQVWMVVVAGMGFLTDAYGIFALNVVIPMLGFVYWSDPKRFPHPDQVQPSELGQVPRSWKTAFLCATLAGTMIGNIAFGIAADFVGRRKMYGTELLVLILSTLALALSSTGQADSMKIEGLIFTWRFIMGLSIGADYPLSAVITAEFAPRKHRARMMTWVFFMQPIGQLLANAISLAVIAGWETRITHTNSSCQGDDLCIQTVDKIWRLVVGLGTIPAVISLAFRYTMPESPRFKMDVQRKTKRAHDDTKDFFGDESQDDELQSLAESHHEKIVTPEPIDLPPAAHTPSDLLRVNSDIHHRSPHRLSTFDLASDQTTTLHFDEDDISPAHTAVRATPIPTAVQYYQPPAASKEDFKEFFLTQGNWRYLLGTSLSWAALDTAYYGLGLSSPDIVSYIWNPAADPTKVSVYHALFNNSCYYLVLFSIGALVGGAVMIKAIKYMGPKTFQFWGFLALTGLFLITGGLWKTLAKNGRSSGLIVLYVLIQLVFNLGPNVTTFIIPAEIFPTRYRCTCHGISAAAGKFASWVVQLFMLLVVKTDKQRGKDLGNVLLVMSAFMVIGAVTTHFLIPETRDHKGKSRTLEQLAEGRRTLKELNRITRLDD